MTRLEAILERIKIERCRQDDKWGVQNHNDWKWLAILMEEVGEVGKAVLERNEFAYERELVEVAAVCLAALESYKRVGVNGRPV